MHCANFWDYLFASVYRLLKRFSSSHLDIEMGLWCCKCVSENRVAGIFIMYLNYRGFATQSLTRYNHSFDCVSFLFINEIESSHFVLVCL